MKIRFLALSLALALTLSGCVTIYTVDDPKTSSDDPKPSSDVVKISSDDLQTCTDAKVATDDYITEYVTAERLFPDSLGGVQFSFAEKLRDFANRNISEEFSNALRADASRVEVATYYLKPGARFTFCNHTFGVNY